MTWPKSIKCIEIPIYSQQFHFISDRNVWEKAVDHIEYVNNAETARGIVEAIPTDDGRILFMIGVFDGDQGTLVHECSHLAFNLLDYVGVPVEAGASNEAYAYLIEFFYSSLTKLVK